MLKEPIWEKMSQNGRDVTRISEIGSRFCTSQKAYLAQIWLTAHLQCNFGGFSFRSSGTSYIAVWGLSASSSRLVALRQSKRSKESKFKRPGATSLVDRVEDTCDRDLFYGTVP